MASELQPLSLLFQNRLFRIPDYQRGYAWQQSQLADFWDDLINLQEGRYHYTGLLSFSICVGGLLVISGVTMLIILNQEEKKLGLKKENNTYIHLKPLPTKKGGGCES